MAWITPEDLRDQAGARQPIDQHRFEDACEVACAKVEDLCGPIPWTRVVDELAAISGSAEACLRFQVTRGLLEVRTSAGAQLPLSDWRVDGQVIARRDGAAIGADILVTYDTGHFDASDDAVRAPVWAREMAKLIGHQYLRIGRRFRLQEDPDLTGTGYLVPAAALEVAGDHLLWRGGAG